METRAGYVAVGAFVLALVAGAVLAVLWLGRYQGRESFVYYDALFPGDVTGLQVGGPVRYRGVPVGRVADIRLDPDNIERVRVILEVNAGTPVHSDSVASLEFQGITGVLYVLIGGGTQESPLLPETRAEPYTQVTAKSGKFESLFQGAPDLIAGVNTLVGRINGLFNDENSRAITDILANLNALTKALSTDSGGVGALLKDGAAAAREIQAMSEQFRSLAEELRVRLEGAGSEATATISELRAAAASFAALAKTAEGMVAESRPPLRDFASSGLYEASQLISDLRLLVASLARVSEQIERDPARFLFGDRLRGYETQ